MPLNSHSYLVDHGWQGAGNALREGAISRPVVISQKKSLAGVGKDRDEAFPFWEHVFTAVAASVKVKFYNDDDEDTDALQPSGSSTPLDRTSTGIISNKPQKIGLSALETLTAANSTGMSVMALAKRESARRGLYSRFFRGPVLSPDTEEPRVIEDTQRQSPSRPEPTDLKCSMPITERRKGRKRKACGEDEEEMGIAPKKGKSKRENETSEERKERRRLKKKVKKGKVSEIRLGGEGESEFMKMTTAPEGSAQGDDLGDHSRNKNREKKRKRKDRESAVRHDS